MAVAVGEFIMVMAGFEWMGASCFHPPRRCPISWRSLRGCTFRGHSAGASVFQGLSYGGDCLMARVRCEQPDEGVHVAPEIVVATDRDAAGMRIEQVSDRNSA